MQMFIHSFLQVVAFQYGFAHVDLETKKVTPLLTVHNDRTVRFNDGKCDPAGRLWAGTMAVNLQGTKGTLYRLDHDLSIHPIIPSVGISNGIVWSKNNDTLY